MRIPTRVFEPNIFSLHSLDQEHAEIRHLYQGLEEAILLGRNLAGILEAADNLIRMILLHFIHEKQFLEKLSPTILQRHCDGNIGTITRLFEIEGGLRQGERAAVVRLLLLGKAWLKEHTQVECEEFEYDGPFPGKQMYGISA